MATTYTIQVSDAEQKALEYTFYSPKEWIESVVKERANLAMQEIADSQIRLFEASGTTEEIVLNATIRSAAERRNSIDIRASSLGNTTFTST